LFRSSLPLPGLSYPVSSSLGLVQAYSACAKGVFTLCAFRSVPKCYGTASPRAPPRTALHVWTDLRGYALNFQQPSAMSRQESITVRLRSTTDAGLSPGKGLLDFFSPALPRFWGLRFVRLAYPGSLAEVYASVRYPRPISLLFSVTAFFEWATDGGLKRLRWGCQSSSGEDLKQLR
jgi:hypothetical protein